MSERVGPRNEVEAVLCEEFADVLGVEVGITDNFFDLGGHSLMATKLAARIGRRLDARVSVKDVFDHPVLADLAAAIRRGSTPHNPILATPYSGPVEQSFAQGRLWFLDQLNLGATWYIQPLAVRMRGPLQIDALTTALYALEQRHETLRTTFEEHDGVGMQVVQPGHPKGLRIIDVTAEHHGSYTQVLQEEQTTPFDLASEPGWRVSLLRLDEDDHILSVVMHHIISDGWSVDILRKELKQFYAAALRGQDPLAQVNPLPIQYRDFSAWQKQPEQVAEHQRQLEYWTTQLADSTPAELLTDLPRPAVLSGKAGAVQLTIEGPRVRAPPGLLPSPSDNLFRGAACGFPCNPLPPHGRRRRHHRHAYCQPQPARAREYDRLLRQHPVHADHSRRRRHIRRTGAAGPVNSDSGVREPRCPLRTHCVSPPTRLTGHIAKPTGAAHVCPPLATGPRQD